MAYSLGDNVMAQDKAKNWYAAKIVGEHGEGEEREVLVHFDGYKKSQDLWIPVHGARLRDPFGTQFQYNWGATTGCVDEQDEQYEVESVLKKRKKRGQDGLEYLVHWAGWEASFDSWEPEENLEASLVEAFNERGELGPSEPFVIGAADSTVPAETADGLIVEWQDDVCRKGANLLARQQEEWAARKFFSMSPCPAWVFCALQRAFSRRASNADAVSEIESIRGGRGGKFIEDGFDVLSTDLVSELIGEFNTHGHGSLVRRPNNTLVMLVPPLEFKFKSRRDPMTEPRKWPTELVVTGHFLCLVDRVGKAPRWAFDEARAQYTAENKLAYKRAVAAAVHAGAVTVPQRIARFLSIL